MAHLGLALLLSIFVGSASALEKSFSEGYLGEKNAGPYAGPWWQDFYFNPYDGKMVSRDEQLAQDFFVPMLWAGAPEWSDFIQTELVGASTCSHALLSRYFDDIRYAHRLLAISYLMEILAQAQRDARLMGKPRACEWNMASLLKSCKPISEDMRHFVAALSGRNVFPATAVSSAHDEKVFRGQWAKGDSISAQRAQLLCQGKGRACAGEQLEEALHQACAEDQELVRRLCSEEDEFYGVHATPLFAHLVGTSNLVGLFNQEGHAVGCLRRFGQLMARKEHVANFFPVLVPVVYASLRKEGGEALAHGRVFVFGALKEFRDKGLTEVFEPAPVVTKVAVKVEPPPVEKPKPIQPVVVEIPKPVVVPAPKKIVPKIVEVELAPKSALLLAAESRRSQNADRTEVDMLKFQYDHVFTPAELQLLSATLHDYTSRKALEEMKSYDKLGEQVAPVPASFIKFLIDTGNHQGLYNMQTVLGARFWMANDVDVSWSPAVEYVELRNDVSTKRLWQIAVIRPE